MSLPTRILIVEDEGVLAQNLKKYLGRYASDVRTAGDGEQALEMLDSFAPDALVLDYGLPGMDGLQTYTEIVRRRAKKIECTMITGNPTEQLAQHARDQGIRHVVCKPFSFSTLLKLLEAPAQDDDTLPA
jgi:DNA-binding response OmpR family regulator